MENKLAITDASVHKMIPSFSIMGISSEYEDIKKSKATQVIWKIKKEIDSLVLQLSTICNKCEEELETYNNIKKNNGK
jgi:hypothetical protein